MTKYYYWKVWLKTEELMAPVKNKYYIYNSSSI